MPKTFSRIDILGEKIRLRPIRVSDSKAAYRLMKNEAVHVNLAGEGPASEEELLNTFRRREEEMKTGQSCYLAIELADQPGIIGSIGIIFKFSPQQADLGYWLDEQYWNKGYMTEAIRLACHLAFEYCCAVRVYATVFVGNTGSRLVLEKNGFTLDGTMRSHVYKLGNWLDCWFFSLLRKEWEEKSENYMPVHEDIVTATVKE